MHNFRGLWATGVVSSCLVPGPEMIKAEDYCPLGCTGGRGEEEGRGGVAQDWLVCISKACSLLGALLSPRIG